MLAFCTQVLVGYLYANLVEWLYHRYIQHGLGKKRGSRFRTHWKDHHGVVRRNGYYDDSYKFSGVMEDPMREIFELLVGALIHAPLFYVFPYFAGYLWFHALLYFMIHRKSHLDPEWAKRWAPWHYDHHMGKNQDANWCVTPPLWDYILGTRLYFLASKDYNNHTNK